MSVTETLDALDEDQKKAVTLETNGIAAAGAGSGKTRVLASRYLWLVTEKNLGPESILTLTFTNKAVSEMYSRIYKFLLEESASGGSRAAAALEEFYRARISTLDSFSAGIARTAASRYGISPDFSNDSAALKELCREAALAFVLDNRDEPAMRALLVDNKIRTIAQEIFSFFALNHSPVSSPPDLKLCLLEQKKTLLTAWREKAGAVSGICSRLAEDLRALSGANKSIAFTKSLGAILLERARPSAPDIVPLLETEDWTRETAAAGGSAFGENSPARDEARTAGVRRALEEYFGFCSLLAAVRTPSSFGEIYAPLVENFRRFKGKDGDGLYHEIESIANYALNFETCAGIFALLDKFQKGFNEKKRETGLLSFGDVARLAVDALKDHPDIRKVYKDSFKMIMVDEFQDNNALQRDLVYLLAENPDRIQKGVPLPAELEKNRMFFVGDEKQSIYRFRGADVAVFRSLGKDLFTGGENNGFINLVHNYRSSPELVAVFNRIFGGLDENGCPAGNGVFPPGSSGLPDYEAVYSRVLAANAGANTDTDGAGNRGTPAACFCFLNADEMPDDDADGIKSQDLEAVFIAGKIREMVSKGEKIPKRKGKKTEWVPCTWSDFAVLERSYTHQGRLEKYFREFGVPYSTDRPSGLFNEAPVLDLRAYLRLLVYPEDRVSYAALIRSPFTRLSDLTLTACMLNKAPEPFAEENERYIPQNEIELYRRARGRYLALREASRTISVTELLVKLWFEEGYRYETLWSEGANIYEGLFDLFYSIACESDRRGKSLADFIEHLEDIISRFEKEDDRDLPGEGESGVRISSIHKCKGLEFPVVFIFDCTHSGSGSGFPALADYHEKYGPVLKIPQADELPLGGNYFRGLLQKEEKAKDTAELRRLLYVAMTRAESRLFLTFTLPPQTLSEKKELELPSGNLSEETLRLRLDQLAEKFGDARDTFLKLLSGILSAVPPSLCGFETIPVLSREEISALAKKDGAARHSGGAPDGKALSRKETALAAASFYDGAEIIRKEEAEFPYLNASGLGEKQKDGEAEFSGVDLGNAFCPDGLLREANIAHKEFGTIAHTVLEAKIRGTDPLPLLPRKIRNLAKTKKTFHGIMSAAESMAGNFLSSRLAVRWKNSRRWEAEFSIVTSVRVNGKNIAVPGKIDLFFEEEDKVVFVDFKTDRYKNPELHYAQLAAYYRALTDIFGKDVEACLFYLREKEALDLTETVKNLSLEEISASLL